MVDQRGARRRRRPAMLAIFLLVAAAAATVVGVSATIDRKRVPRGKPAATGLRLPQRNSVGVIPISPGSTSRGADRAAATVSVGTAVDVRPRGTTSVSPAASTRKIGAAAHVNTRKRDPSAARGQHSDKVIVMVETRNPNLLAPSLESVLSHTSTEWHVQVVQPRSAAMAGFNDTAFRQLVRAMTALVYYVLSRKIVYFVCGRCATIGATSQ
jgi:hypothetical protein